jgi:electron transfer flavoprotein alpha/beta subunit
MRVIVCLHAPPAGPDGERRLARDDAAALAKALSLGPVAPKVTAVLAGTSADAVVLQRALAAGAARAVRVTGEDFSNADFHTVGQALGSAIKKLGADLVLTGARSDEEGLGAVAAATARQLGTACVSSVEAVFPSGEEAVEVLVRGVGRKRRLRVAVPAVLAVTAVGDEVNEPPDRTGSPNDIELLSLSDPEATVVRRRTELLGKPEPASRGAEQVTSAAALVTALKRR